MAVLLYFCLLVRKERRHLSGFSDAEGVTDDHEWVPEDSVVFKCIVADQLRSDAGGGVLYIVKADWVIMLQ